MAEMRFRKVGRGGLSVSEIAYGNWITHGGQVGEEAAVACVRAALDAGITTFDTADVYSGTRAEQVLGRALRGVRREGIELCTKIYWVTGPGPNDRGLSRKHLIEGCHASLRRLGTDYVDVYYAHRFDTTVPLEETMSAFADLVHAGKVHYLGVSEWTAEQIRHGARLARELRVPLIASQPQYSMLWRVIEPEVLPACRDEGLGQLVWSPLAQGILTGKYQPGQQPPEGSRALDPSGSAAMRGNLGRWMSDEGLAAIQKLGPLAAEAGLTMAQLAIAWVLQSQDVAAAIIGATRPEQVADNAGAAGVRLEPELMHRINEVLDGLIERDPTKTGL